MEAFLQRDDKERNIELSYSVFRLYMPYGGILTEG